MAQGGELPVANTNGFDYREVAFQFTETLTERDYDFPVTRKPETWVLGFHFRWTQRRMPIADWPDDLFKHLVHHMTDATFEGFVFLW